MKLIRLSIINMKRQIKNPLILVMGVVFPLIMLVAMFGTKGGGSSSLKIGIIDGNNTVISKNLINELEKNNKITMFSNVDEAKKSVEDGNIQGAYFINNEFQKDISKGQVPKIELYKIGDEGALYRATNTIDSFIKENILKSKGVNLKEQKIKVKVESEKDTDKSVRLVTFISYFMIIGGSYIAVEMISLKNQKVLKRTIATANTDREILGSLFISCVMTQITLSLITYFAAIKILGWKNMAIGLSILAIVLSAFIGTAFISVVVRWIKNPTIAELIIVGTSLIAYIVGIITASRDLVEIPQAIYKIGELSPFTWIARIPSNGEIVMPTIVLLLMTVVLFTVGSFKLKEFARD